MCTHLPRTQRAVQLVGRDELVLKKRKPLRPPGPRQIVCQVEAVGLCFSDLKLIKQFMDHARKSEVTSGIEAAILAEIPSYVPGALPTVPGHEAVVRIAAVGSAITRWKPGERYLVQTDYRWLSTAGANAAFGYNFEGALQEYVLMDERVIIAPEGESMLIPVSESLSASSVALVEPWACVEDAYADRQRRRIKARGQMLVVSELAHPMEALARLLYEYGESESITSVTPAEVSEVTDARFDDIVYFGADAAIVEQIFPKLTAQGLMNIVTGGAQFTRRVAVPVGRVHYHGLRLIGTTESDPAEAMTYIPTTSEIRDGERMNIIGAGGPMGVMHVLRTICLGKSDVSVFAADLDTKRLFNLSLLAAEKAAHAGVGFRTYEPGRDQLATDFTYIVVMVPAPALVTQAVAEAAPHAIINVFAGLPLSVNAELDLNAYLEKHVYLVGTSGSTVEDMQAVLARMEAGKLDTNVSVAAVCGLEGAIDGIRAVEQNLLPGKIVVYPSCQGLNLTPLAVMAEEHRAMFYALTDHRYWNHQAEEELFNKQR